MRWLMLVIVGLLIFSFSALAQEELDTDALDDTLAETADPDGFALVILISNGDEETWIGTSGFANLEEEVEVQSDDKFRIGSITKTFVSVVVLQLVEEEKLSLDDLINDWLPDDITSNIPYSDEITIRQLMNMTSGIYSYTDSDAFNDAIYENPTYPWTAEETIEYVYPEEALFPPGEGYSYSNTNYNLLQIIVESIEESSLANVMQARIFEPTEMMNSYVELPNELGEGIVQGYTLDENGEFINVTYVNEGNGLGDGGIISTVEDLELFARALFEGELISEDSMAEMMDYVDDGEGGLYGLALGAYETDLGMMLGHDGATAGFQSTLIYLPDYDLVLTGLTNNFDSEVLAEVAEALIYVAVGE